MIDFSFVVVNFRTPKLTVEAVKSIISHEKKIKYEIIVVDNNSGDNSISYLSKYLPKSVRLILSDENLGFGRANNLGLAKAKGRFFVIFNSDAYEVEEILPKIKKIFDSRKNISILGTKILYPNYELQQSHGSLPGLLSIFTWMFFLDDIPILNFFLPSLHKKSKFFYKKTVKTGWVTGALMVFKRSVYRKLNGFNPEIFLYSEDIDICLRAKKHKHRTYFFNEVKVIHIGQQSSKGASSSALIGEVTGLIYISKKYFNPVKYLMIKLLLTLGSLLRLTIFGIILKSSSAKYIYSQILKIIWGENK